MKNTTIFFLLIIISLSSGCASLRYKTRKAQKEEKLTNIYYSTTDPKELKNKLYEIEKDPSSLYLLGLLNDETGYPEEAFINYLEVIKQVNKTGGYEPEAIAASMGLVAIRNRVANFEEKITPLIKEIFNNPSLLHPEALFQLRNLHFSHALHQGSKNYDILKQQTGCITSWKIAGPIGPDIETIFNETGLETTSIWPHATASGHGELEILVQDMEYSTCTISNSSYPDHIQGVSYARTNLKIDKKTKVSLRFETGSTSKIYIGSTLVFKKMAHQSYLPRISWFEVELEAGIWPVTVKMAQFNGPDSFSLVAYDENIKHITQTEDAFIFNPVSKITPKELTVSTFPPSKLASMQVALWWYNYPLAYQLANSMSTLHPLEAMALFDWNIETPFDPMEIAYENTRHKAQKIFTTFKDFYRPARFLASYKSSTDQSSKAINILDEALKHSEMEPVLWLERASICGFERWESCRKESLNMAKKILGKSCSVLRAIYQDNLLSEDFKSAWKTAQEIHNCHFEAPEYLLELKKRGSFEKIYDLQKKFKGSFKNDPNIVLDAATTLTAAGKKEEAIKIIELSLIDNPDNFSLLTLLADNYLALGKTQKAMQVLTENNAVNSAQTLNYLAKIIDGSIFSEYRVDGLSLIKEDLSENKEYETDSVWVLDRMVNKVDQYGGKTVITHSIIKLLSTESIQRHGEIEVLPGTLPLIIRTVKSDGQIRYPDLQEQKTSISLVDLQPGDYIEYESIGFFPPSNIFPGGFDTGRFYFQDFMTHFKRSELILITPLSMLLSFDNRGKHPPEITNQFKDFQKLKFKLYDNPPMEKEPMGPVPSEYLPSVRITGNSSNTDLCRQINNILISTNRLSPQLIDFTKNTFNPKGKDLSHEEKKLIAPQIYTWILQNIENQDSLYDDVPHIFSRKAGNRARLLYAMLDIIGIDANLGFVKTPWDDQLQNLVPDTDRLGEIVVNLDDNTWLYLTNEYTPFGYIPAYFQNQEVLFPQSCEKKILPTQLPSGDIEKVSYFINTKSHTNAQIYVNRKILGQSALEYRSYLNSMPKSDWRKIITSIATNDFQDAIINRIEVKGYKDVNRALNISYKATSEEIYRHQKETIELILPDTFSSLLKTSFLAQRKTPLVLGVDAHFIIDLHYTFDNFNKATLQKLLDEKTTFEKNSFCSIKTTQTSDNSIKISIEIKLNIQRVKPENYQTFLKFIKDSQSLVRHPIILFSKNQ